MASRLGELREEQPLTQEALAAKAGVARERSRGSRGGPTAPRSARSPSSPRPWTSTRGSSGPGWPRNREPRDRGRSEGDERSGRQAAPGGDLGPGLLDPQDDGYSLPSQLEACRAFCAERGWDVAAEFRVVFTAKYLRAVPEWRALEAAIERREVDVLVALKYDRLARHHWDIGTAIRTCEAAGVRVAFAQGDVPEGEFGDVSSSWRASAATRAGSP
jgi:hypothetical protein